MGLSHDELAHNLAQHLDCDSRMVWEDLPAGMAGSVRPDVYTIEKSFSNPNPITYEVKVSVADFRSDVTKAKWKSYLRFSWGVVFAVPKGLITKADIPKGCGLITYNGDGIWHTVKKPTLNPCSLDGNIMLKLLIGGKDRMTKQKPLICRGFDKHEHFEKLRKKFGQDIGEKISLIEEYPHMKKELTSLKKELGAILGIKVDKWCFIKDAEYRIEQIRIMADEQERKKAIAKELSNMLDNIKHQTNKIIKDYTQ